MENIPPPAQSSKTKLFIALGTILTLGVGAFAYFSNSPDNSKTATPPSIQIAYKKFQGSIGTQPNPVCQILGGHLFNADAEVTAAEKNNATPTVLKAGIQMYHSDTKITVKEILAKMKSVKDNKIFIAYYPSTSNTTVPFSVYPGLSGQTPMPETYIIPANEGFVIFSCKNSEIYGIKSETEYGSALPEILATKTSGWVLMASPKLEESEKLSDNLKKSKTKDNINFVWPQKDSGFKFGDKEQTLEAAKLEGTFKMVWVEMKAAVAASDPTVTKSTLTLAVFPGVGPIPVPQGTTISLDIVSFLVLKPINLKSLVFTTHGSGNITDLSNFKLFSSAQLSSDGQALKNETAVTGCKITAVNKNINVDCDLASPLQILFTPYLELRATLSPTAKIDNTYKVGIAKLDDIQLYDTNFDKINYTSSSEYTAGGKTKIDLPIYGNEYKVTAATPAPAKPAKPTVVSTATTADITWLKKEVAYRITSQFGSCPIVAATSYAETDYNASTVNWTTLKANTTYSFTLAVKNTTDNDEKGWSPESDCVQFTTSAAGPVPTVTDIKPSIVEPGEILDGSKKTGMFASGYNPKLWLCVENLTDTTTPFTIELPASPSTVFTVGNVKIEEYTSSSIIPTSFCGKGMSLNPLAPVTAGTAISAELKVDSDAADGNYTITLKQGTSTIGTQTLTVKKAVAQQVTTPKAPSAPTEINVTPGTTSAKITWKQAAGDVSIDTGLYDLTYSEGKCPTLLGLGANKKIEAKNVFTAPNLTDASYTLTGLLENKNYLFYLMPTNDGKSTPPLFALESISVCKDFTTTATTPLPQAEVITLYSIINENDYGKCDTNNGECKLEETCNELGFNYHVCKPISNPLPVYQCNAKFTCAAAYMCMNNYKCVGTASCLDKEGKEIGKPIGTGYLCTGTYTCNQGLSCDNSSQGSGCTVESTCKY